MTERRKTGAETVLTMMTGEGGVVVETTVIVLETDTGTRTARERGVATGKVKGPTAVEEVIVVIGNEKETVRIVTETAGANAKTMKSLRAKSVQRGGDPTRMSTTETVFLVIARTPLTETVLPTEDLEVGLLSIHGTNSMIHPDIEGIGITVVERAGAQSMRTTNSGTIAIAQEAQYLLLGM